MMAEEPLRGKVAIVTGAGSPIGIGHAITLGFVRAGARVAMLDLNQTWLGPYAAAQPYNGKELRCSCGILSSWQWVV
jgi:NAD(P)-dependent dehydrogenase (short-subunit alcohol dehydrogenase family)